jgi:hypothetical protein
MRVLLSPRAAGSSPARAAAERLAAGGDVVSLPEWGVATLERRLTFAEVDLVRRAMTGAGSGEPLSAPAPGGLVGYVCVGGSSAGSGVPAPSPDQPALVAVGDHAGLTWRSPLWGPDDGTLGARFPQVAGLYRADVVIEAFESFGGGPVSGVVVGVRTHGQVSAFVRGVMAAQGWTVWSAELVPVALVAAHMDLGVTALVVLTTAFLNDAAEGEDGS